MRRALLIAVCCFVVTCTHQLAVAWPDDPTVNLPVCDDPADQEYFRAISDGSGGVIVVWEDERYYGSTQRDIYVQKIDGSGTPRWTENGVPVCTYSGDQREPVVARDGHGGAIVVWQDNRYGSTNWNIYAQRIDALGALAWDADGLEVCARSGNQTSPEIADDGNGNAIVVWQDDRDDTWDVYAQRLEYAGGVSWTGNGVEVVAGSMDQKSPQVVHDGFGGAIVVWEHGLDRAIHAQRLNGSGATQWTSPSEICTSSTSHAMVSGAAGQVIVTWDFGADIFGQLLDGSGSGQWGAGGLTICDNVNGQDSPAITSDRSGGAVFAWVDLRNDSAGKGKDIYAQHVEAAGSEQWTSDGVMVCSELTDQIDPDLVDDSAGSVIVTWRDSRNYGDSSYDLYAQRLDSLGEMQWAGEGIAVSTAPDRQWKPQIVGSMWTGAIVVWEDRRDGNYDVFAQKVLSDGELSWALFADGFESGDTVLWSASVPR